MSLLHKNTGVHTEARQYQCSMRLNLASVWFGVRQTAVDMFGQL